MKKVLFLVSLLLVGCSNQIDYSAIDTNIDKMQTHMESFAVGNGDYSQLEKDTRAFNELLDKIDTKEDKINKLIEYQLKANELRLKGVKEMDSETITESAKYQSFAENLYYELEGSR